MAKLGVKDIQTEAVKVIRENPGGIRYTNLVAEILKRHPETPQNTIHGSVWNLDAVRPAAQRHDAARSVLGCRRLRDRLDSDSFLVR